MTVRAATERLALLLRAALAILALLVVLASFMWVFTRPLRREARSATQVELTVLHWGDKNEDEVVAGLVREFEALNPDVRILRTNVGSASQLATKLQTMLASGTPPDVFYLPFEKVADLGSKDLLADIEEYVRSDEAAGASDALHLADFFPAVLDAFRYDVESRRVGTGTLVGLAKDFTTVGFYYNKDLFARAGVPLPPRDGWTWNEFAAAARAIGKLPGCFGADFVTWESMVRIYLYSYGVDAATPGFERDQLSDPRLRAALEQLRAWFHDEDRTLLSAKTQLETGQEPFLAGNIGLAGPFGRWKVPTYRRIEKFDWDFAPFPHAAGQAPANGVLTVAWAMSKRGTHPRESWRLIKYLCGEKGQRRICQTGLAIPSLRSVAAEPCFVDPAAKPENDDVFLSAAMIAQPVEWPADPRYMDQMRTAMENIYKLGRPVGPELDALVRQWSANRTPTIFRAKYERMPWGIVATWILLPLGVGLAILAYFWWVQRPGVLVASLGPAGRGHGGPTPRRRGRQAVREELAGLAMASPWGIGFIAFTSFPIVLSLLLAFCRWSGLGTLEQAEWVGFDNFRELTGYDETFRRALYVTSWYALLAVPTSQLAALVAALLMNREMRGIGFFRAVWYLPSVLAGVGMAIMWKWVFHHEHGLLNALLDPLLSLLNSALAGLDAWFTSTPATSGPAAPGLTTPAWLEKDATTWGVPAFALINIWMIGGTMMIYLAGLKGIPKDLYEAAEIDGASAWRKFCAVTLPMLSPVIFFNFIMAIIASFQIFTQVYVMTGGGPGTATHFFVFYIYKMAFDLHNMGYASAMAWMLLLIVLVLTLAVMRGTQRFVYYEALKA